MSVYLVAWTPGRESKNHAHARATFVAHVGRYDHIRDPGLDSAWFVSTNWTADQVSGDLRKMVDEDDRIIVVQLYGGSPQGWLAQSGWNWISVRL